MKLEEADQDASKKSENMVLLSIDNNNKKHKTHTKRSGSISSYSVSLKTALHSLETPEESVPNHARLTATKLKLPASLSNGKNYPSSIKLTPNLSNIERPPREKKISMFVSLVGQQLSSLSHINLPLSIRVSLLVYVVFECIE